jgi:hypothetical protein
MDSSSDTSKPDRRLRSRGVPLNPACLAQSRSRSCVLTCQQGGSNGDEPQGASPVVS